MCRVTVRGGPFLFWGVLHEEISDFRFPMDENHLFSSVKYNFWELQGPEKQRNLWKNNVLRGPGLFFVFRCWKLHFFCSFKGISGVTVWGGAVAVGGCFPGKNECFSYWGAESTHFPGKRMILHRFFAILQSFYSVFRHLSQKIAFFLQF